MQFETPDYLAVIHVLQIIILRLILGYMQFADKAARTLAMLTARLGYHRGRCQQQIVVKHVTVNANQARVADKNRDGKTDGGLRR
jgi:hypothetical protein